MKTSVVLSLPLPKTIHAWWNFKIKHLISEEGSKAEPNKNKNSDSDTSVAKDDTDT